MTRHQTIVLSRRIAYGATGMYRATRTCECSSFSSASSSGRRISSSSFFIRHQKQQYGGIITLGLDRCQQQYRYMSSFRRSALLNENMQESANRTTILATSSKVVVGLQDKSFLKRIMDQLRAMATTLLNAILVAWRSGEIVVRFSPLIILTPAAILNATSSEDKNNDKNKNNPMSDLAWNYSLYTIQKLGPTFIKLCQWAATRRDLFPPDVCDRLSQLHDATFLHSWKHTHAMLSQAFGENYEKGGLGGSIVEDDDGNFGGLGLKIDPKDVIGSGSVAQVYRGSLIRNGVNHSVAVKVLHPNIHRRVERDLELIRRAASLIDTMVPLTMIEMLNLPRVAENFSNIMRHQLDLRNERNHLDRFSHNFALTPDSNGNGNAPAFAKVRFPTPLLADANCLVEDYEDAIPISNFLNDDSEEGMRLRRELAGPLLRAFLKMVFMDNFVHSDLHQGNVKVRKFRVKKSNPFWTQTRADDGSGNGNDSNYVDKYTIVFLDAGIVTELNKQDQQNLKDLFKAVITNDGKEAGRLMVSRAKYERCSQIEGGMETFSKGIEDIVSEFHDRRKQGLTLGVVRIGTLLSRVLDLCRIHGVEIDPAMSNIVMSTLVLEGLGRSLDANLNLIDIALPFILGRGKV